MAEYAIGPLAEPRWRLDADDFAQRLRRRWRAATVRVNSAADDLTSVDALIPFESPRRELGVALHSNGQFLSLDPADPRSAAEFAVWFVAQVPENEPQINVINPAAWPPFPLTVETTEQQVVDFLTGQGR